MLSFGGGKLSRKGEAKVSPDPHKKEIKMAPHVLIIALRFLSGLVIAVSGFVVASYDSSMNRIQFIFGLASVIAAYIAAFIDRSVAQHNSDKIPPTDELLNEFMVASGFNRKDAEYVLKTNREFAEETVARSKAKK